MQKYYIQTEPYEEQLTGSLWTAISNERWRFGEREQEYQKFSKPLSVGVCKEISPKEFLLLVAIPDLTLRLEYFRNRKRCNDGLAIEVGSRVEIISSSVMSAEYLASDPSAIILQGSYVGTVLYIGSTRKYYARMFGVRLDDNYEGMGCSSGEFQEDEYFSCKEDCAMFLAAHRLVTLERRGWEVSSTDIGSPESNSLYQADPRKQDSIRCEVPPNIMFSTPTEASLNTFSSRDSGIVSGETLAGSGNLPASTDPSAFTAASIDPTEHGVNEDQEVSSRKLPGSKIGVSATTDAESVAPKEGASSSAETTQAVPATEERSALGVAMRSGSRAPNKEIQIGDRVAMLQGTKLEYGTVKWIGYLPDDLTKGLKAGVEFDNPIGRGSGKYRSVQLFNARMNHALVVPKVDLVKLLNRKSSPGFDDDLFLKDIVEGTAAMSVGREFPNRTVTETERKTERIDKATLKAEVNTIPATASGPTGARKATSDGTKLRATCEENIATERNTAKVVLREEGIEYPYGSRGCMAAVLYAMFRCNQEFKPMLDNAPIDPESSQYQLLNKLKNEIITPLQNRGRVSSTIVKQFQDLFEFVLPNYLTILDDPIDNAQHFLDRFLHAEHLVMLACGDPLHVYSIPCVKVNPIYKACPTLQHLLDCTSVQTNDQFASMPRQLLILARPKNYMYVVPSLYLDLCSMLQYYSSVCCKCELPAVVVCADCLLIETTLPSIAKVTFCEKCYNQVHKNLYSHKEKRFITQSPVNIFGDNATERKTIMLGFGERLSDRIGAPSSITSDTFNHTARKTIVGGVESDRTGTARKTIVGEVASDGTGAPCESHGVLGEAGGNISTRETTETRNNEQPHIGSAHQEKNIIMELFAFIAMIDLKCVTFVKHDSSNGQQDWNWFKHENLTFSDGMNEPLVTSCFIIEDFLNNHEPVSETSSLDESVTQLLSGLRLCFYRKIRGFQSKQRAEKYLKNQGIRWRR